MSVWHFIDAIVTETENAKRKIKYKQTKKVQNIIILNK